MAGRNETAEPGIPRSRRDYTMNSETVHKMHEERIDGPDVQVIKNVCFA